MILSRFLRALYCSLAVFLMGWSVPGFAQGTQAGVGTAASRDAPIFVDVGSAGTRKFRIAVAPFVREGGQTPSAVDLEEYSRKLERYFSFTGSFDVQPRSGFIAKPDAAAKPVVFEEWKSIRTEGLVFAKFSPDGTNGFSLEARFFDVARENRRVGKLFRNLSLKDVDAALRRFADLCIEALTGELGVFSSRIAFVAAQRPGENKQVYMANFDGSGVQQVTFDSAIHMSPAWSPDGSKLTFTSFIKGKAEIFRYDVTTKKVVQLTQSSGNNSGSNWSFDGRTIAFSGSVNGRTSIFTMRSADGSDRTLLVGESGLEVEPAFSPDGRLLAWASGRFGNPHIFVRQLSGKRDVRITTAGWYNSSPSWRPDGKKLAFAGYDRDIDRYDIFIVNPDGTGLERLTLDQGDNEKPSWSPDGRFLLFQSNRAASGRGKVKGYRLWMMNRDGGNQIPLQVPFFDVSMPAWGPRMNLLND
jgi:TolB protein